MICATCAKAGKTVTNIKANVPRHLTIVRDAMSDEAEALHKQCEYPESCPCHHDVSLEGVCTAPGAT
jgi:hypothetical protein